MRAMDVERKAERRVRMTPHLRVRVEIVQAENGLVWDDEYGWVCVRCADLDCGGCPPITAREVEA